jgi:hypothetical protein
MSIFKYGFKIENYARWLFALVTNSKLFFC